MMIFHWEYVIFPIIIFILLALILAVLLAADIKSEGQTKTEIIKGFAREVMKRLHRR